MGEADESYWLLSETSGIGETRDTKLQRNLPVLEGLRWLAAGWRDFWTHPASSLAYGVGVFVLSVAFVWTLVEFGRDYILFPSLAGFLIVAPFLAIGLYEKSRAIGEGREIGLASMLHVRPRAGAQIFFTGLLLCLLMLLWMRAAVLLWALFFGVTAFPGLDNVIGILIGTPSGWAMLIIGAAIGGLFASFAFSISVFAVPMLLDRRVDALTAMATSMKLVWNNLPPMIAWGAMVLVLFGICVATGLIGMIVIFPLLGHATWQAYRAVARPEA
ncbi:DUF2189 domain-containing protein [Mesorhizobium sp.]|uniref:DUF2189 domain-containing protein n=1 Tax=Mesorhizobium sp. TaxID=1871066 RepID=UPI000FE96B87|nr:DUF2189 domain-containing protein [Mesorhizobium sp.]RWO51809.1 MAG: DUF2189 domain-containing protein [Mesorhizobium sp.]TIN09024.1 MAG: DUF2189 domain-containing protein [Mesorhizobium sp.]TIN26315.1 MAG: DUF2189 domain-containing protein [Mesorhizobium sp.]TIN38370.1 MAG: DUF2189 domain-containing protein [Mesorhizobium sp.]TJU82859.1 MAG: DUF2189 domain-containing protein [Mesorhizobium sp.]